MAAATSSRAQGLGFGMLGPLLVTRAGQPLPLGGRQQKAVLALLLAEAGSVVSVGRLADALWGERTPPGFATTVQTYIYHLREVLEPDRGRGGARQVLVTESGGYRLQAADDAVDARVFERLVTSGRELFATHAYAEASAGLAYALSMWRGDVLADVADYDFVAPVAGRLQELRLAALESKIDADLALGRHTAAVAELDQLIARQPLREQPHAQRMLALYRCGRQSDALAEYRELHRLLDTELGIEPSPPLQQLHRAILAQDADLAWSPPAGSVELPEASVVVQEDQSGQRTVPALAPPRSRRRRSRWVIGAVAAITLAVIGAVAAVVVSHSPRSSLRALPANSVGAVHADGSLHDAITVGQSPDGLLYGAGALWATNATDGTVSRIDPGSHAVVQTIQVGAAPTAVTVIGQQVWVANGGDGTVSWINAVSDTVVDTIAVGALPAAIGSGLSGVWVANSGDGTVQRIDAANGKADKPIPVGAGPDGIAVDEHAVWVANGQDGTVSKLDPATGDRLALIPVGAGAKGIAVTPGAVWVANSLELTVSRIDPSTDRVMATVPVGDGPTALVADPKRVWVSDEYDGTIAEIDPASNRAVRRIAIGGAPRGLALIGSTIWLATGSFTSSGHLGGTLTIASAVGSLPGAATGIDPANNDDIFTAQPENLVYDGLADFRRTGGVAGLALVPDLAMTLPRPADGGLTYTFTLRPGIRYSTGALVHAADIRRGVQRALTLAGGQSGYFASIVGGPNCRAHPAMCDLSAGVVTDDSTRRVTFHLTTPDPDFLEELTLFVYPTPAGTSTAQLKMPLPGTGPYMITGYQPTEKQFTLTRNPFFRQWSYAAQPAGYPDTIRWHEVPNLSAGVADVIAGRADAVAIGNDAPARELHVIADLARQYPAQLHPTLWFQTSFAVLNTAVAPFSDVRVRRAVNYAVDRRQLVDILGGPSLASATCQFLPPNFPGYQPYCPYTTNPSPDGSYHGPNLAAAQRLVAESGTSGTPVTVVGPDVNPAFDEYFVQLLSQLGYRATLREIPDLGKYYAYVFDSRNRMQITNLYWATDFPSPANFFATLSCRGFVPANGAANNNPGEYCRPEVDKLASEARAAEIADSATARRLWARVDRMVTDDAAVVATVNGKIANFVSTRLGNFQSNPQLGPLYDQMWVQ